MQTLVNSLMSLFTLLVLTNRPIGFVKIRLSEQLQKRMKEGGLSSLGNTSYLLRQRDAKKAQDDR